MEDDPESRSFWNSFLLRHPEQQSIVTQASAIIKVAGKQQRFTNEFRKDVLWTRINKTIEDQADIHSLKRSIPQYMKIAAAVAFVIASTGALWLFSNQGINTVTTAYNEVTTLTLPNLDWAALIETSSLHIHNNFLDNFPG